MLINKSDNSFTLSVGETMEVLIGRFFPEDSQEEEIDYHTECRQLMDADYEG